MSPLWRLDRPLARSLAQDACGGRSPVTRAAARRVERVAVEHQAGDERAELRVVGGHLVEAHLVDDLLERDRVVGEQRDAPLPVVEAGRAGDELQHPAGVGAADACVAGHQLLALLERQRVPVASPLAALRHRVEADDRALERQLRVDPLLPVVRDPLAPRARRSLELVAPVRPSSAASRARSSSSVDVYSDSSVSDTYESTG